MIFKPIEASLIKSLYLRGKGQEAPRSDDRIVAPLGFILHSAFTEMLD